MSQMGIAQNMVNAIYRVHHLGAEVAAKEVDISNNGFIMMALQIDKEIFHYLPEHIRENLEIKAYFEKL